MFDTATLMQLNDLRGRVLRNEHVSDEELRAALETLAQGRAVAATASKTKKEKSTPIVVASGATLLERMAANLKKQKEPLQGS